MGLNFNLHKMFGATFSVYCPLCKRELTSRFRDFDIECDPIEQGELNTHLHCVQCEKDFPVYIKFNVEQQKKLPCKLLSNTLNVESLTCP